MGDRILANGEALIGLALAGKPSGTSPSAVSRWCSRGVKAPDGRRVRLEHVRAGGKLLTSAESVARFFTALTDEAPTVVTPSPVERRKAAESAMKELEAAGA